MKGDVDDSDDKGEGRSRLVQLSEATKAWLETVFSSSMANSDHKKRVEKFGVPDCDHIRCLKLDPVLKSTMLNDAIKVDGFLS